MLEQYAVARHEGGRSWQAGKQAGKEPDMDPEAMMLPEADLDMMINAFSAVPLDLDAHKDAENHQHTLPHMEGKGMEGGR
ncbi:hypothetical protein MGYG_04615 [Nannizzia gypsea CBS 118893]|uniref:Uncharacterized protein n=1 Tax=Arthroderma gypseum (strain ATCC MYA-4604 / CBS 118893) TaxID=535722 RepID=E4UU22_ARTGP|nr:hypothetical protein MGYG_04615 [Nannizzia gypsea CBS 118893]EFR01612.1 hypothetical protein MGYG_04615 [Nannizzia gypsea CBS 118893]